MVEWFWFAFLICGESWDRKLTIAKRPPPPPPLKKRKKIGGGIYYCGPNIIYFSNQQPFVLFKNKNCISQTEQQVKKNANIVPPCKKTSTGDPFFYDIRVTGIISESVIDLVQRDEERQTNKQIQSSGNVSFSKTSASPNVSLSQPVTQGNHPKISLTTATR